MRRRNHAGNQEDLKYEFWYPLIEWGWAENAARKKSVPPVCPCRPRVRAFSARL
jgi:hypothetical protein